MLSDSELEGALAVLLFSSYFAPNRCRREPGDASLDLIEGHLRFSPDSPGGTLKRSQRQLDLSWPVSWGSIGWSAAGIVDYP